MLFFTKSFEDEIIKKNNLLTDLNNLYKKMKYTEK